jgi:hypothetical protein
MIGSRGYRIAEPLRTSSGQGHSPPLSGPFQHLCAGSALRARAPPAAIKSPRAEEARPLSRRSPSKNGTGPAEAPASPVRPRSTRNRLRNATEYGTELRYDYKDYIGSRSMQGVLRPF